MQRLTFEWDRRSPHVSTRKTVVVLSVIDGSVTDVVVQSP